MPFVVSIGTYAPPYKVGQEETMHFARTLFDQDFADIERLLNVFQRGQIRERYFSVPLTWFQEKHSFEEKNHLYIKLATEYGKKAIENCLHHPFLRKNIAVEEIEAIFFVSSSGIATPSIEARIMNVLPFSAHTKRVPIWGLGCAGGGAGLARAYEYCLAFPSASVLVVSVELCSLTFQPDDRSKSNLIGTSLFADGVACALVCGDRSSLLQQSALPALPSIKGSRSTLMPDAEQVMGWDVKDHGFYVVFSKDIPLIIQKWLRPNVEHFLSDYGLNVADIDHFVAHPGGKKVLDAYQRALGIKEEMNRIPKRILRDFGNMSSATVFYVLQAFMWEAVSDGEKGLLTALGPGFSSELMLLEWGSPSDTGLRLQSSETRKVRV